MTNSNSKPGKSFRSAGETRSRVEASLAKRYGTERRFRLYGFAAVLVSIAFIVFFFISIISQGYTAFSQTYLQLDVHFDSRALAPGGTVNREDLERTFNAFTADNFQFS